MNNFANSIIDRFECCAIYFYSVYLYQNHLIFLKIKNAKADKVMEISTIKINPCGISSILLITFIP